MENLSSADVPVITGTVVDSDYMVEPNEAVDGNDVTQEACISATNCTKHHQGFSMVCCSCEDMFVCPLCIEQDHNRHIIKTIESTADVKRDMMNIVLQNLTERDIPRIEKMLEKVRRRQRENRDDTQHTISNIREQAEIIKAEVNKLIERLERNCRQIETRNEENYKEHEQQMEKYLTDLKSEISNINHILKNGNVFDIIKSCTDKGIRQILDSVPTESLGIQRTLSVFSAPDVDVFKLHAIFGDVQELEDLIDEEVGEMYSLCEIVKEKALFASNLSSTIRAISPTSSNAAWIASQDEIKLISDQGCEIQDIQLDGIISILDICTDAHNMVRLSCDDGSIQYIRLNGTLSKRFETEWTPESLCIAPTGEIIVGLCSSDENGKIVKYNSAGEMLLSAEKDASGQILITNPYRVRINQKTCEILVVNWNPDEILLFDRDLNLKWRYSDNSSSHGSNTRSQEEEFEPYDACFDEENVLVADYLNREILLLNKKGKFLKTLVKTNEEPRAIAIDNDRRLWIGFENSVKIVEYL